MATLSARVYSFSFSFSHIFAATDQVAIHLENFLNVEYLTRERCFPCRKLMFVSLQLSHLSGSAPLEAYPLWDCLYSTHDFCLILLVMHREGRLRNHRFREFYVPHRSGSWRSHKSMVKQVFKARGNGKQISKASSSPYWGNFVGIEQDRLTVQFKE